MTAPAIVSLCHTMRYHYDPPAQLGPQIVRLCPIPYGRVQVPSYSLTVTPREHDLRWFSDPAGNRLARFAFPQRTTDFVVEVAMTIEVTPVNPFDFLLEPAAFAWPFVYDDDMRAELAGYLVREPVGPAVTTFLASPPVGAANTVDFLVGLNIALHNRIQYETRQEPGVQEPEQTLARAAGSCRDIAWLLVTVLRHMGCAARFVSGYLVHVSPGEATADAAEDFSGLHAWVEVYLPGAGWVGLDPTAGTFCGEGYIALAACAHYRSAAPLTGSVEHAASEFAHDIRVELLSPPSAG